MNSAVELLPEWLPSTCLFYGIEQDLQTTEELYDAAELPVDLDVLHPSRTLTHHTAVSRPGGRTGPESNKPCTLD